MHSGEAAASPNTKTPWMALIFKTHPGCFQVGADVTSWGTARAFFTVAGEQVITRAM